MRLGAVPDNPVEWAVARLNVAPRPLLETQFAYTLARVIMVARGDSVVVDQEHDLGSC